MFASIADSFETRDGHMSIWDFVRTIILPHCGVTLHPASVRVTAFSPVSNLRAAVADLRPRDAPYTHHRVRPALCELPGPRRLGSLFEFLALNVEPDRQ